ncbi:hypothetical protein L1987_86469 [Smallanthus sonchifolius]|uniref:Uncharacterized protein n=1 Tax=Smallanthus sonchifolius TaxID=185202 RepID=A0ACB8Y0M2_9ASTR|nr:hypothetical protein L1987_86469 [Smallanthus sonchifolius]
MNRRTFSKLVFDSGREKQQHSWLLDGSSEFVLTYEDKEGDWMLVGDVPWRATLGMLASVTVRRGNARQVSDKAWHCHLTAINLSSDEVMSMVVPDVFVGPTDGTQTMIEGQSEVHLSLYEAGNQLQSSSDGLISPVSAMFKLGRLLGKEIVRQGDWSEKIVVQEKRLAEERERESRQIPELDTKQERVSLEFKNEDVSVKAQSNCTDLMHHVNVYNGGNSQTAAATLGLFVSLAAG